MTSETPFVSVVIPVFNEERTLRELVNRVLEVKLEVEIILVDDGSTDRSVEIANQLIDENPDVSIRLTSLSSNQGKGAAVRTGFDMARGKIVIIQDADLEYNPNEYSSLIQPILDEEADVVFGSRFLSDDAPRDWHATANRMLTRFSNLFTRLNLTDMETCFKVFRIDVVRKIAPTLTQRRFGIEPEITAKVARLKYRVHEVPITYSKRSYAEGKKIGWLDGLHAIWCVVRYGCFR